ncbi:MAG: helix-turn-helix transcriptional regulator, partial [Halothece sp.]
HILEKALNQAPTLSQLARQVGLNERKLKEGFQQVFQTTPFEYLRDRRLEQAKHLLLDTNQSVQEVARAIGYRSRSQFANAFRQKFGVNPKAYQRHWRKKTL